MAFDPTKPVRTRDGRAARIICTDAQGSQPIVALIVYSGGEAIERYNENGSYNYKGSTRESSFDLVNIPERRSYWMNIYEPGQTGGSYNTRQDALIQSRNGKTAQIEFVYEDDKLVEVIKHDVSND